MSHAPPKWGSMYPLDVLQVTKRPSFNPYRTDFESLMIKQIYLNWLTLYHTTPSFNDPE